MAKDHVFTEGEKRCMEEYWQECSKTPRKNLIKLVKHINILNPAPTEKSWEYIFFDRMLSDEMVDFLLKMKLRSPYYIKDLAVLENMSEYGFLPASEVDLAVSGKLKEKGGLDFSYPPVYNELRKVFRCKI